jgi:hypothetical protein
MAGIGNEGERMGEYAIPGLNGDKKQVEDRADGKSAIEIGWGMIVDHHISPEITTGG